MVGGTDLKRDPSLEAIRPLAKALKLTWSKRTARGFFLRAEYFFNFARRNRELSAERHFLRNPKQYLDRLFRE